MSLICSFYVEREKARPDTVALIVRARKGASQAAETVLGKVLIVNERHLRQIITAYLHHVNAAWPHRALAQLAPAQTKTLPPQVIHLADYQVHRRTILDGLTSEHQITV